MRSLRESTQPITELLWLYAESAQQLSVMSSPFPVSSLMTGEYGLENVVLSIPAVVDENGIETVVPIELNEKELSELQQSATVLKKVIAEFYPD